MGSMRLLPNLWSWEKSGLSNFRFDAEGDASREDDGDVDGASALVGSESCRWVASGRVRSRNEASTKLARGQRHVAPPRRQSSLHGPSVEEEGRYGLG